MKVPFIDLSSSEKFLSSKIKKAIENVIRRKDFILGKEVKEFEENFSKYIGCRYTVGVCSGSSGLFLALKALDISSNDYVITTPFTFTATAEVILHCNAKVIFVDIDKDTYNISVEETENALKKFGNKVKAVIPVHLYGQPCNMQDLLKVCKEYNIKIVEDAAQAHGAIFRFKNGSEIIEKKVGSIGEIGCFSFYPTKNLGCYGDGGAVTTNDEKLYQKLLRLRNHGRVEHYLYQEIGYNSRLDNLQAAILLVKLNYLDKLNKERQKIAQIYTQELKNVGDIVTPYVAENVTHVYHLYVIKTSYRDKLKEFLKLHNIGCAVQYDIPLHLQPAYKGLYETVSSLKNSEITSRKVLSLPIYPGLKETQIEYVINTIKKFFKNLKK
ncbi:MAG: DegT/DnrJ/EryC1/StrS family aminotransferase [Elusimicrobiota bacterium]|nr:DegT/DnrJ/EryC1/StrS family aminotransferase [Endomicrobiia bacterium]MDW8165204.1 DegT/DnrJ/EryC1/StrS family aminotransferase [Elusimicrobiota bacterium]